MLGLVLYAVVLARFNWRQLAAGAGDQWVVCELRWPRRRYDIRRLATVFPMGMTAAASFAVGQAEQLPALAVLGHLFLRPALAAWAVTAAGATRGRWRRLRRER